MVDENIRDVFEKSRQKFLGNKALSFVDSDAITYEDLNHQIISIAHKLKSIGIVKGDKVAILSNNCPNWGIAYLATIYIGAVTIPILNEFSKNEIQFIINHSEAKALFVSENLKYKIADNEYEFLNYIINIEDFSFNGFSPTNKSAIWNSENILTSEIDNLNYVFGIIEPYDLATIIYTSGTTGSPKGVMLTHKNLISNINSTFQVQKIVPETGYCQFCLYRTLTNVH